MGWKGAVIGGILGKVILGGLGPLGILLGAAIGHGIEKNAAGPGRSRRSGGRRAANPREEAVGNEMVFCASAAAMLAKLAKADGAVTPSEIEAVELAFARLGFSDGARRYAIDVFRKAKDDAHDIREYAEEFASAVGSVEVRELLYELLWDLACADGTVRGPELEMLRQLPRHLGVSQRWFDLFADERLGRGWRGAGAGRSRAEDPPPRDELAEAYATFGVDPSASDAELRRLYREKAKKYHPDALRAQGLPDEMVGRATERMAKINAAWDVIRRARNLK